MIARRSTTAGDPVAQDLKEAVRQYWAHNPNALKLGAPHEPGSSAFLQAITKVRYEREPCVPEMAQFGLWRGKRVLEIGCGLGVDAFQFARNGAIVTALDLTRPAAAIAREHLRHTSTSAETLVGDGESLPFASESFDLVYSHGVLHHTPDTQKAVREVHRVLKKGGQAQVMLYHRRSYLVQFLVPWVVRPLVLSAVGMMKIGLGGLAARLFPTRIAEMAAILARDGYSRQRLLSLSTDPSSSVAFGANPLSKFFDQRSARELFKDFSEVTFAVRQLYRFPPLPSRLRRAVEHRFGGFLYIKATK